MVQQASSSSFLPLGSTSTCMIKLSSLGWIINLCVQHYAPCILASVIRVSNFYCYRELAVVYSVDLCTLEL